MVDLLALRYILVYIAHLNELKLRQNPYNIRWGFHHPSLAQKLPQAHVQTAEEPCIAVITTPIIGSSTAHVMRGVNPHHGRFLGDSFTSETRINSSVCY